MNDGGGTRLHSKLSKNTFEQHHPSENALKSEKSRIILHSAFSYTCALRSTKMNSMWLLGSLFLIVVLALSRVQGQGLSDEEKAEILYAHNHFRGQVDPIATNMLKMVR